MSDDWLTEQTNRQLASQWMDDMRRQGEQTASGSSVEEGSSVFQANLIFGIMGGVIAHYQLGDLLNTDIWWQYGLLIIGDIAGFLLGMILIPLGLLFGAVVIGGWILYHLGKWIIFSLIF